MNYYIILIILNINYKLYNEVETMNNDYNYYNSFMLFQKITIFYKTFSNGQDYRLGSDTYILS